MNIFLNEYFGFCFELNFELNHFSARFNEKMNFQNVLYRAIQGAAFIFLGQHDEVDAAHEEVASHCTAPCPRLSTSGLVGSISWRYMMRPPWAPS